MLDGQRKIAIYWRAGELWVAEFNGEHGVLCHATTWFRSQCGICRTSFSLHRAVRHAVPLSPDLEAAIEKLHQRALEAAPARIPAPERTAVARAARRASIVLAKLLMRLSGIRDRLTASAKADRRVG